MKSILKTFFFYNADRRDFVLSGVVVLLCCVLYFIPTGFEARRNTGAMGAEARIVAVDNRQLDQHGLLFTGAQTVTARLLEGPMEGRTIEAQNLFSGKMELDKVFKPGDLALVNYATQGDRVTWARATDHYRLRTEFVLLGVFCLFLLGYGGFTGFQAMLSFFFTGLTIWKVLIPLLLKGYDPIGVTFVCVSCMTAAILFLVAGVTLKGLVAFLGACSGLGLTCLLALLFLPAFKVNGAVRPFSETLLFAGFLNLDLTRLFVSGIFLAASGAVMDLAMDLSAAMQEIVRHNPAVTRRELFLSGLMIGRSVIGSMTTTLVLAYSGGYIAMLMFFMGQGISNANILNLNHVAAEILHTLVGSFGLVLVAPATTLIGTLLYLPGRRRAPHPRPSVVEDAKGRENGRVVI